MGCHGNKGPFPHYQRSLKWVRNVTRIGFQMAFVLFPRLIQVWMWALRLIWETSFQLYATSPRCTYNSPPKRFLEEGVTAVLPASVKFCFILTLQTAELWSICDVCCCSSRCFWSWHLENQKFLHEPSKCDKLWTSAFVFQFTVLIQVSNSFQDAQRGVPNWTRMFTHYLNF